MNGIYSEMQKLSSLKVIKILVLVMLISGCSLLSPFVDRRRNAGEKDMTKLYVGKSKIDKPAICYNGWITDFEEAVKLADEECEKHNPGTVAEFEKKTYFSCKLFIPNHVYFNCVKKEEKK